MKKLFFLFVVTLIVTIVSAQVSIKIKVYMPGYLYTAILETGSDPAKVTNLTVTGKIDARDFKTMRDDMPALTVIDLSRATITSFKGIGGSADTGSLGNVFEVDPIGGNHNETPVIYYPANTIPKNAFANHSITKKNSRFTSIILPVKITSIGDHAFYRCNNLITITIPEKVKTIDRKAFYQCPNLISVTFLGSVKIIGIEVFSGCNSLDSINIPQSVISIGNGAFSGSNATLTVDANNTCFVCVDGVLFDKTQTKLLHCTISKQGSYIIPNTVKSIASSAFENCKGLIAISIPTSVTSLGWSAFYGCSGLTSVTIPNSVTSISGEAFYGCSGLKSIVIPNSVTYIRDRAFNGCSSLKSINLPNSITYIGHAVFADCSSLTTVNIPNMLASISMFLFSGCSNLTIIDIPNSVTSINNFAFKGCESLISAALPASIKTIEVGAFRDCIGLTTISIPDSLSHIATWAFAGCSGQFSVNDYNANFSSIDGVLFNKNQTELLSCPASKSGNYSIPATVTFIASGAFDNCNKLTTVNIHSKVDSIPGSFTGCSANILVDKENRNYSSLDGVLFNKNQTKLMQFPTSRTGSYIIPNSVITIDGSSFEKCDGLTSIVIPESVNSLGANCFNFCTSLTSITVYSSIPVKLSFAGVFYKVNTKTCKLYVPSGSKSHYQAANQWKQFENIIEVE